MDGLSKEAVPARLNDELHVPAIGVYFQHRTFSLSGLRSSAEPVRIPDPLLAEFQAAALSRTLRFSGLNKSPNTCSRKKISTRGAASAFFSITENDPVIRPCENSLFFHFANSPVANFPLIGI